MEKQTNYKYHVQDQIKERQREWIASREVALFAAADIITYRINHTVQCEINSKKRWGGFLTRPLFRFSPSTYFYLMGIATTRQVKKFRRANSLKKRRKKSKGGQNWQNPWILSPKLTSSST
ncbi:MAG: hypothetical protein GY874_16590 [Desulfobacteraceae bacterium]|nr:hypothetical protein [Desulfobacteraceae bacterium]